MRILVTGGAGYIGSVTTQALIDAGHEPVVLDDLSAGSRASIPPGVEHFGGRVGDSTIVKKALDGVDGVVHFAALIEAGESMEQPELFFENNTAQALSLLRAVVEAGIERFVFSSTAAVYGEPVRIPIEEDDRRCRRMPTGRQSCSLSARCVGYKNAEGFGTQVSDTSTHQVQPRNGGSRTTRRHISSRWCCASPLGKRMKS